MTSYLTEALAAAAEAHYEEYVRKEGDPPWRELDSQHKFAISEHLLPAVTRAIETHEHYRLLESAVETAMSIPAGESADEQENDANFVRLMLSGWIAALIRQKAKENLNSPVHVEPEVDALGHYDGVSVVKINDISIRITVKLNEEEA